MYLNQTSLVESLVIYISSRLWTLKLDVALRNLGGAPKVGERAASALCTPLTHKHISDSAAMAFGLTSTIGCKKVQKLLEKKNSKRSNFYPSKIMHTGVCVHTLTPRENREKARVRNILKSLGKKTQYLMNTLYVHSNSFPSHLQHGPSSPGL